MTDGILDLLKHGGLFGDDSDIFDPPEGSYVLRRGARVPGASIRHYWPDDIQWFGLDVLHLRFNSPGGRIYVMPGVPFDRVGWFKEDIRVWRRQNEKSPSKTA